MPATDPALVRTIALVGHAGSGKTTLAEALAHQAGATARPGRVEDGTTISDHDPLEIARGASVVTSVLTLAHGEHQITLLDTPGDPDLAGELDAALRVADLALVVVSAVDGVQVGTRQAWRAAEERGVPRMIYLSKLDRDRADFDAAVADLRAAFGDAVAPVELPIGVEHDFHGVVDVLRDAAYVDDGAGRSHVEAVPEDMAEREHVVHDALVEGIVVGDDSLLERYLDGQEPSVEELERTLTHEIDEATVVPVLCGAAPGEVGVDHLLDLLCELAPSPLDRPPVAVTAGDTTVAIGPDPDGPAVAFVFKTVADRFVGHVSLFRVLSGTIHDDDHLVNSRTATDERLHGLFQLCGATHRPVTALGPGQIGAVAKLATTLTGDTLAPRGRPVVVAPLSPPEAVLGVALVPRTQADDDRLGSALHRLVEQDPSLRVERHDETHQVVLRGAGETHLALAVERLAAFGVDVTTDDVAIAYRETVSAPASAEGRHKKQTGGHGQFAVCTLTVGPRERGSGSTFESRIVGGAISKGHIPAVERGVEEALAAGGPLGYPVVDVAVVLTDGKEHAVDSSEMAFRAAARLAVRDALAAAGPVLLEPIVHVEVTAPVEHQGDVMGDLSARRGRIEGAETGEEGETTVVAAVPAAEMGRYAVELRSLTGGRGRFTSRPHGLDPVPEHLVARATERGAVRSR